MKWVNGDREGVSGLEVMCSTEKGEDRKRCEREICTPIGEILGLLLINFETQFGHLQVKCSHLSILMGRLELKNRC